MIDLSLIASDMEEDIESVNNWATEIYDKYFSSYFKDERELFDRLKSKAHPITDAELEWILTCLPLELFSVSEALSQFQISQEVVKIRVKQEEAEKAKESTQKSEYKKKEDTAYKLLEHKLVLTVYNSVVSRVNSEISFSRELIMSAKKIWDARRQTDNSNPVGEVNPEDKLPDYTPPTIRNKHYVG